MVKKMVWALLVASVLGITLLAVSCSCGSGEDLSTTPPNGGGSTPPEMKTVAGVIEKVHTDLDAKNCLSCHKPPIGDKHIPIPGVWHSYWQNKDFTVVAGTVQDHSGYTVDECFNDKCHIKP